MRRMNMNGTIGIFFAAFLLLYLFPVSRNMPLAAGPRPPFGFENVVHEAKELSAKPYREHKDVPDSVVRLEYDQWRDIRFKPAKSFWRQEGLPFTLQFFHPPVCH